VTALFFEVDRVLQVEARVDGAAQVPGRGRVAVAETDRFDVALPADAAAYLRSNRHANLSGRDRLFVATLDDGVAGITVLGRGSVRCHGRRATVRLDDDLGYSYATFVSGHVRGHGVGSALLGAMLSCAAQLGLRTVYAIIHPRNAASLRLYEREGFVVTGEWRFRRVFGIRRVEWIPATAAGHASAGRAGDAR